LNGWFRRHERCRTCGIAWHREDGFEIGALTINTIITFAAVIVVMAVVVIVTAPDVPAVPLVAALTAVGVMMPVVIYPFTYTIWLAIDLRVHPPDRTELDEALGAMAVTSNHDRSAGEVAAQPDSSTGT
jgi:hypothetical protein